MEPGSPGVSGMGIGTQKIWGRGSLLVFWKKLVGNLPFLTCKQCVKIWTICFLGNFFPVLSGMAPDSISPVNWRTRHNCTNLLINSLVLMILPICGTNLQRWTQLFTIIFFCKNQNVIHLPYTSTKFQYFLSFQLWKKSQDFWEFLFTKCWCIGIQHHLLQTGLIWMILPEFGHIPSQITCIYVYQSVNISWGSATKFQKYTMGHKAVPFARKVRVLAIVLRLFYTVTCKSNQSLWGPGTLQTK